MLHISFEDNGTSSFVDCMLLMAPHFAVLSALPLKASPQVEGIQQKVTPVHFSQVNGEPNTSLHIFHFTICGMQ